MFVRLVTPAENAIKNQETHLIPHLLDDGIQYGRFFEDAKSIKTFENLYSYNRKATTTEMPRHSIGYDFAIDRRQEAINPARAIPNPQTPPEVMARVAVPDLPPKIFGM